jgi:hypothetical protein
VRRIGTPPALLVAGCGLICLLFVLVVVRTRDDANPPTPPPSAEVANNVLSIARTLEAKAASARLAQELAAINATLVGLERSLPGCPDCGGSVDDGSVRLKELQRKQAELRRRIEEARVEPRRLPQLNIPRDCQINPLAKGCM